MTPGPALHSVFCARYPQEAAQVCESFEAQQVAALCGASDPAVAAQVLGAMAPAQAAAALAALPAAGSADCVARLPLNVAATLLAYLERNARADLLAALPVRTAEQLERFLAYPPDAVGSLMDPQVLALPRDLPVRDAIVQARAWPRLDLHDLYVIDRERTLLGKLTLQALLLAAPDAPLHSVMDPDPLFVHPLDERERIVALCNERYLFTVPVLDLDHRLLGVVRTREIFQAGQDDASADMLTMVGASRDERALSPVLFSVRKRLPWLQVNLLTAFLAAFVVGMFEDTIARFTALAVLLPVVAGQSGNTGSQSLAVVMRGLALRDILPVQWMRVGAKEVSVAFVNGIAVALTTALAVYVWSGSLGLVLVIVVSMVLSMVVAGFAGAVIPIVLRLLNQDPAQSSSIILTTVTDVVGFFSFLGLATVLSFLLV